MDVLFYPVLDGKSSMSKINLVTLTENVHKQWAARKLEMTAQL
jgi:hypothetical protein